MADLREGVANALVGIAATTTEPTAVTAGTGVPLRLDQYGRVLVGSLDRVASGTLGALNAAVTLDCKGLAQALLEIDTGTLVGTVVWEATNDDSTWYGVNAIQPTSNAANTLTTAFPKREILPINGYSQIRLRVSVYTSGTSNARIRANNIPGVIRLAQSLNVTGDSSLGQVDSGTSPVKIGATAVSGAPAPATAGNRVEAWFDTLGSLAVFPVGNEAGGALPYSFLSTAAVQAASIKASAGQVYGMQFFNKNAAAIFVRLYDQSGSPVSTDTANIKWRGMVPGQTTAAGFIIPFPVGLTFASGIGIRVTAAVADNDTTVLPANDVMGNVNYS